MYLLIRIYDDVVFARYIVRERKTNRLSVLYLRKLSYKFPARKFAILAVVICRIRYRIVCNSQFVDAAIEADQDAAHALAYIPTNNKLRRLCNLI